MNQLAIEVEVRPEEVAREKTLGGAIGLCLKVAGLEPKEAMTGISVDGKPMDKAQFSRWESGQEGVVWPKFRALMEFCGNDAPLLWMLHQRGYDLHSLRKMESETQIKLREAEEEIRQLKNDAQVQLRLLRDLRALA